MEYLIEYDALMTCFEAYRIHLGGRGKEWKGEENKFEKETVPLFNFLAADSMIK